jgi:fructose/tagatose bisphosphate aldolase
MEDAERGGYAVGYFESWNLESLLAVADAAEATRSPVLLGFSGLYLTHPARVQQDPLAGYAALGLEVCRALKVPSALLFNESPDFDQVIAAIELGFSVVMFSDENLAPSRQKDLVGQVVKVAHRAGVAVEGEAFALPGVGGDLQELPRDIHLTTVETAREFVRKTGVDAFAVNLGQIHFHGRRKVDLDLERLDDLYAELDVPIVLHGSSSVTASTLRESIQRGVRKINVGSSLKQSYFEALQTACEATVQPYNPYEVIGSGFSNDVLSVGRIAMQRKAEELMHLFGSAGRA